MIQTKVLTQDDLTDLSALFCSNRYTDKCWCMWHIIAVKTFHAGGAEQNEARFRQLVESSPEPLGIMAYRAGKPAGWCAVGPRERYARAIRTPTYRTQDDDPREHVWLVPCFFVHQDIRGTGMSKILLNAAVSLAREHGADAVDGFPFTSEKRRSSSQIHVGFEAVFLACGFAPLRRPSASRVVMRRVLD